MVGVSDSQATAGCALFGGDSQKTQVRESTLTTQTPRDPQSNKADKTRPTACTSSGAGASLPVSKRLLWIPQYQWQIDVDIVFDGDDDSVRCAW